MGTNFHTAWATGTKYKATEMEGRLDDIDHALTYLKRPIISCDGDITYAKSTGTLTWSDILRIHFISEAGLTILNTVAAGNVVIADNYIAYVTLNETNETVLTVSTVALSPTSASNFLSKSIMVLAYKNATSDDLSAINLPLKISDIADNPYDVYCFIPGTPEDIAEILRVSVARAVSFPANFSGSYAICDTADADGVVFTIYNDTTEIGTITFATSEINGVLASTGGTAKSLVAGDILRILGPDVISSTSIADIGITLVGTR